MILRLFDAPAAAHPLADPRELRRVLAELPARDDLKAVDELGGWLESIANSEGFPLAALLEAVRQVDEAGQPHLRRLTRHYVTAQLVADEERRLWTTAESYWAAAADAYGLLVAEIGRAGAAKDKPKGLAEATAALPLLYVRLLGALAARRKWRQFRYEPAPGGLWQRIGAAYRAAVAAQAEAKPLQVYPLLPGATTATQEYVQAIALEASSLDALKPAETELAEKLIAHFAPQFALGQVNRPDNLYWVDAALDQPPLRLARLPKPAPTVWLLGFGQAPQALAAMIRSVERGEVPPELVLGGQYPPRLVLKVLRHLAAYWAAQPPLRQHQRHAVKGSVSVLRGFEAGLDVVGDADGGGLDFGELWSIENVSLGGFGAATPPRAPGAAIGDLLALQPEGGGNWLLGVVRRFSRAADGRALVGVETITRQGRRIALRRRGGSGYVVAGGQPAVLLDGADAGEGVRVLLPAAYFDLQESYDSRLDERPILLSPVELLESGPDYQIGRYRLRYAE